MKSLLRLIDLILYTSLFTACCALGLCMATERLIDGGSPPFVNPLHILVFGSSLLVYNTPRLVKRAYGREVYRHDLNNSFLLFFIAGIVLTAIGLYPQPPVVLATSALLGIFAFAYFLPLLPFKTKKRLRDYGWLKITVLAGVWTIATSVLPMLYWHKSPAHFPFEIALRFVFIFTLCVVFDIRDIRADMHNRIATLPNMMGLRNSYRLINLTLSLFICLSLLQFWNYPAYSRLAGALLTAVATWLVVAYLRRSPSDRAYVFLADGVMLLYAALILIPA